MKKILTIILTTLLLVSCKPNEDHMVSGVCTLEAFEISKHSIIYVKEPNSKQICKIKIGKWMRVKAKLDDTLPFKYLFNKRDAIQGVISQSLLEPVTEKVQTYQANKEYENLVKK